MCSLKTTHSIGKIILFDILFSEVSSSNNNQKIFPVTVKNKPKKLKMLTGFFKSSEPLERCVEKLDRFADTSFAQLISDQAKPIRYKVKAIYIYCSKSQKKYRTFQPAKGTLTQVNKEITTFDRFLVLGVPETPHVMISFLKTPAASKQALRFSNHMAPGDNVCVIMPRVISYLGPQNPEILTSDPIIPIARTAFLERPILPPADVDAPNYTYFDFVSNSLNVFSATPQDNVCTGTFCDSQTITASCACTATDPHKHWALCVTFTCDEFCDIARDHVSLTSKRTSAFFIAEEKLQWPLTNETIDPFDLDDAVSFLYLKSFSITFFMSKNHFFHRCAN